MYPSMLWWIQKLLLITQRIRCIIFCIHYNQRLWIRETESWIRVLKSHIPIHGNFTLFKDSLPGYSRFQLQRNIFIFVKKDLPMCATTNFLQYMKQTLWQIVATSHTGSRILAHTISDMFKKKHLKKGVFGWKGQEVSLVGKVARWCLSDVLFKSILLQVIALYYQEKCSNWITADQDLRHNMAPAATITEEIL